MEQTEEELQNQGKSLSLVFQINFIGFRERNKAQIILLS